MLFINKNLLKRENGYILLEQAMYNIIFMECKYEKKNIIIKKIFQC